jgi:hypothetical protein
MAKSADAAKAPEGPKTSEAVRWCEGSGLLEPLRTLDLTNTEEAECPTLPENELERPKGPVGGNVLERVKELERENELEPVNELE